VGVVLAALAFVVLAGTASGQTTARPPNVVVIFADDLGYADIGPFSTLTGAARPSTPNLDRMAAEGVRLTDFYVAQAVCSASRAALLTGSYSNRVGIRGALNHTADYGLNPSEVTIAEVVKARGYATAIFGKWHLGHQKPFLPLQQGFDEYFGLPYSNDMWPRHPQQKGFFPDLPLYDGDSVVERDPDQSQLTRRYTERAVRFIERNRDTPFFLYVPHTMPHVPLFASKAFAGKTGAGLYADVIAEIDWSVGQILDAVKRIGADDNTLVIFTSDNGPWASYGNHAGSAGAFRESKGTTFEGGVRVPFVARWPGRIPKGTTSRVPAMTIDLLPTIAKLSGGSVPMDRTIDGRDLWPALSGQSTGPLHDALYFYWGAELHAVRSDRWKLHVPHPYQAFELAGRDGSPGKYVRKELGLSLFDLNADPGESSDVAASHPDVVSRLLWYVERARDDLGDSLTGRTGRNLRPATVTAPAPGGFSADRVQARLQALVAAGTTPSIAAAVGRDGRISWSGAAGLADVERKVAATPATPYSVASISKPFTATAVMALRDRKLIDLDAPLSRYVGVMSRPGMKDDKLVTVERTLGHVAGFPTHYQFFYDDEPPRPLPFAERVQCYGIELTAPGDRYNYSNLGFGILGELVARVAGTSYPAALAREVLAPLGLSNTFVPERAEEVGRAATRYASDGQPLPFYVTDHAGGSEVYASAEDLVRFGLFHAGTPVEGQRAVLSSSSLERMSKAGSGNYGLGWSVNSDWNGRKVIWHSGGMPGVATTLWVVPSERLVIAVVANKAGVPVNQIAGEMLGDLLNVSPPSSSSSGSGQATRQDEKRSAMAGRWRGTLDACAGGEQLVVDISDAGAAPVVAHAREGSRYQFDLRLEGPVLAGTVRRTTSLGARGSNSVTLPLTLHRVEK
jgi:arylsulfatase A-like enzyme/CubicO group peptidase (beta-lactamase class C family)